MSKDIEATIGCMRALGAHIVVEGSTVTIEGLSSFSKEAKMNCEELKDSDIFLLTFSVDSNDIKAARLLDTLNKFLQNYQ